MDTSILTPQSIFTKPTRYEIPPFQRPYVWEQDEQWEPLWEDINNIALAILEDGQTSPHFMGAVVFQQRPNPTSSLETRVVVDGQQRLTTLQLLIDAVQEVLEQRDFTNPAKRLSTLVKNGEEFWDGNPEMAFKVLPTIHDRKAFRHAMQNDLSSRGHEESKIVQAHNFFRLQAEQWLDSFPKEEGKNILAANAIDRALRDNLSLVVIDLGNSDDPYVIFETLNARGTPLKPSDMIKNYILHNAKVGSDGGDESSRKATELWDFGEEWWMEEVGRGHQRRSRIDLFMNNWLTLRKRIRDQGQRRI